MTITYEPEGDGAADSDCTPGVDENESAPQTRTDTTDVIVGVTNLATDEISAAFTTPSGEPNVADWPNGAYRGSLEIGAIHADVDFAIQLHRINSGCTTQQTLGTSGEFATTGPHIFSVTIDPSAGAAGDRYQMRLICDSIAEHGAKKTFTITINDVDTFMDGPWVAGGTNRLLLIHPHLQEHEL